MTDVPPANDRGNRFALDFGIGRRRFRVDLPDLVISIAILAGGTWYFLDARSASRSINNLILVAPATALLVILCLLVCVRSVATAGAGHDFREKPARPKLEFKSLAIMGAFGLYLFALPVAGFDLGSFLMVAICLIILGERNLPVVFGFSAALSLLMGWAMSTLPTPLPMVLF